MKKKILPKKNLWLILWHLLWVRWYQRRGQRWMQDGRLPAHGTMEAEALLRLCRKMDKHVCRVMLYAMKEEGTVWPVLATETV